MKSTPTYLLALFVLLLAAAGCSKKTTPANAQQATKTTWKKVNASAFPSDAMLAQEPTKFQAWKLDMTRLKADLGLEPPTAQRVDTVLLPMPDGTLVRFAVYPAKSMSLKLQEKFPDLHSWSGRSLSQPVQNAKLNLDQKGFRGMVTTQEGVVLIEPAIAGSDTWYMAFLKNDLPAGGQRTPSPPKKE